MVVITLKIVLAEVKQRYTIQQTSIVFVVIFGIICLVDKQKFYYLANLK